MKKIIIILVIILLLAGGGGAGWWFFLRHPEDADATAAKEEEKKPLPDPVFVRISPLVVPVVTSKKVETFITLVVSLELADQATALKVTALTPRLVDAFLTALYGVVDDSAVMDGKLINIPLVKKKLQEAADKALGPKVVHSVLVQTMTKRGL